FLYSGGAMHDLGVLSGNNSQALAINNAGHIVGTSGPNVLWANGTTTDLGGFSPAAINDAGQVAGSVQASDGSQPVALWANGAVKVLGGLAGYQTSVAAGINAAGQ